MDARYRSSSFTDPRRGDVPQPSLSPSMPRSIHGAAGGGPVPAPSTRSKFNVVRNSQWLSHTARGHRKGGELRHEADQRKIRTCYCHGHVESSQLPAILGGSGACQRCWIRSRCCLEGDLMLTSSPCFSFIAARGRADLIGSRDGTQPHPRRFPHHPPGNVAALSGKDREPWLHCSSFFVHIFVSSLSSDARAARSMPIPRWRVSSRSCLSRSSTFTTAFRPLPGVSR
jgi:hypothetical protein